jgi:hypothetical protein
MHGRHAASSFAFASLLALLAPLVLFGGAGCLGRTGLYLDDPGADGAVIIGDDTGTQEDVPVIGDDTSVSVDSAKPPPPPIDSGRPPSDTGINIFEVFPIPDSGPIGVCATCVANHCASSVNACVNDPNCLKGLACSVQKCLGGGAGGFDFGCLSGCFGGDLTGLLNAVSAFTCVTGTCGTDCGGLLGGLGGAIPGLPGAGGGGGAGAGGTPGARGIAPLQATTLEELRSIDPNLRLSIAPDAFDAWREPLARSACAQGLASCEQL